MSLYKREYEIQARNSELKVDIQLIIQLLLKEIKNKTIEQIKELCLI